MLLNPSAYLIVCGWYAVAVMCSISYKAHSDSKPLLMNLVRLFGKPYSGIPYWITQLFKNYDAICESVVLDIGTALINFMKRSGMTITNWLPFIVFGSGPKTSIVTDFNGPLAVILVQGVVAAAFTAYFGRIRQNLSQSFKIHLPHVASNTHVAFSGTYVFLPISR